MSSDKLQKSISGIDDDLILAADSIDLKKIKKTNLLRWSAFAASICVVIAISILVIPTLSVSNSKPEKPTTEKDGNYGDNCLEMNPYMHYSYAIDNGPYKGYIMGKAINEKYIESKIDTSTVTAGWVRDDEWNAIEHSRIEIYKIEGVSPEVAIAIRFLDELEAETTTQYYVNLNLNADLSSVSQYIIEDGNPLDNDGIVEE